MHLAHFARACAAVHALAVLASFGCSSGNANTYSVDDAGIPPDGGEITPSPGLVLEATVLSIAPGARVRLGFQAALPGPWELEADALPPGITLEPYADNGKRGGIGEADTAPAIFVASRDAAAGSSKATLTVLSRSESGQTESVKAALEVRVTDAGVDGSFGTAGVLRLGAGGDGEHAGAVELGDGSLAIAISAGRRLVVVSPEGAILRNDTLAFEASPKTVTRTPSGGFVVFGSVADGPAAVGYKADGTIEKEFGIGGLAKFPADKIGASFGLGVDSAGRFLAFGRPLAGGDIKNIILFRATATGAFDATYGDAGYVSANLDVYASAENALFGSGDTLTFFGERYLGAGSNVEWGAVRLLASGARDTTFGPNGTRFVPVSPTTAAYGGFFASPDGSLTLGGMKDWGSQSTGAAARRHDVMMARITPDGKLDMSFGEAGLAVFDLSGNTIRYSSDAVGALLPAKDGGVIFVAGQRPLMPGDDPAVGIGHVTARGVLDQDYAPRGRALIRFPDEGNGDLKALSVLPSKTKLGRGYVLLNTGKSFHLVRVFL